MKLGKKDLAPLLAQRTGVTQKLAKDLLDTLLDVIAEELVSGKNISLPGIGVLKVKETPERVYRSPLTNNENVTKPAHRRVTFKAATSLSKSL